MKREQTVSLKQNLGLPWWLSGWESACKSRGHGFEPWSGKIPHAAEQLGPWATATEPARLEFVLCNKRGPRTAMKSGPRSLQLEKALAQKWRPNTVKNKYKLKKKKKNLGLVGGISFSALCMWCLEPLLLLGLRSRFAGESSGRQCSWSEDEEREQPAGLTVRNVDCRESSKAMDPEETFGLWLHLVYSCLCVISRIQAPSSS